jgi:hypothetical protein
MSPPLEAALLVQWMHNHDGHTLDTVWSTSAVQRVLG